MTYSDLSHFLILRLTSYLNRKIAIISLSCMLSQDQAQVACRYYHLFSIEHPEGGWGLNIGIGYILRGVGVET
jgi:hypothetical protein